MNFNTNLLFFPSVNSVVMKKINVRESIHTLHDNAMNFPNNQVSTSIWWVEGRGGQRIATEKCSFKQLLLFLGWSDVKDKDSWM